MQNEYLKDKNALITGGASGMGKAIAKKLANSGVNIAVCSLLSKENSINMSELSNLPAVEEMEKTKLELKSFGIKVLAGNVDVTKTDQLEEIFEKTKLELGSIDILVNAAGVTIEHILEGHPEESWLRVIDVNVNGVFRASKLAIGGMKKNKWGRIINIASTAAHVGAETSAAYCASKAAVVGFTRAVALEGASFGVTCNSISPTWVESEFGRKWIVDIAKKQLNKDPEAYLQELREQNPQKRLIQPEEIGAVGYFLCTEEAKGINGEDIRVTGGAVW